MMPGIELFQEKKQEIVDDIDFEDVEYYRQLIRPAEIKEDVILVEQRHRVSGVLNSNEFHGALNKILDNHLKEGEVCGGLAGSAIESNTTESIYSTSNLLPRTKLGCSIFNRGVTIPIIPINDLRSLTGNITKKEKFLRCKLASLFRLIDLCGWASGMMLHSSTRIVREEDNFLVNSLGLMNTEVTARNLVRINFEGESEDGHSLIDLNSWVLHAALHKVDSSMRCVVYIKTPSVVAVSCMRSGLLMVSDEAVKLGTVPMYEWGSSSGVGSTLNLNLEQEAMGQTIGDCSCILIRNRGLLARGRTVEEAWCMAGLAVAACDIQLRLVSLVGSNNLLTVIDKGDSRIVDDQIYLQFEALMRSLDSAGYQTGYLYRHASIMTDHCADTTGKDTDERSKNCDNDEEDVQIPPSVTSFPGHGTDKVATKKDGLQQWYLHTTSDYVRQEETEPIHGSNRRTVSWHHVSPDQRQGNVAVEVSTCANQFAPQGRDPREFRHHQQKIKAKYYHDETDAGHQSQILRSLNSSETMVALRDTEDENDCAVVFGAVSRGIIDKNHRQDPSVYHSSFKSNPFNGVTDDDLQEYQRRLNRLTHGLPVDSDDVESHKQSQCAIVVTGAEDLPRTSQHLIDDPENVSERLCVSGMNTVGSETSHDETEYEGRLQESDCSADPIKKKKKSRKLRAIFSFRKDKSK